MSRWEPPLDAPIGDLARRGRDDRRRRQWSGGDPHLTTLGCQAETERDPQKRHELRHARSLAVPTNFLGQIQACLRRGWKPGSSRRGGEPDAMRAARTSCTLPRESRLQAGSSFVVSSPPCEPRRTITVVGCHAGGEVGNVIVGGVLPPAGATVFEQMETLRREGDWLRRVLLREPRGSVACHANLVVPPTREDCDAGFIIMEPTEYPAMSGSNTICVTTVLLETGMVEMREPETVVRLEAPGGVVEARAACRDGKCESVEFTNVPCFVGRLDARARGRGTRHAHGRRRLRRHVVRDRRRGGARLRDRRRRRRATSRWRAKRSERPRVSNSSASTPRTRRSPASASSRSPSRGTASAR